MGPFSRGHGESTNQREVPFAAHERRKWTQGAKMVWCTGHLAKKKHVPGPAQFPETCVAPKLWRELQKKRFDVAPVDGFMLASGKWSHRAAPRELPLHRRNH